MLGFLIYIFSTIPYFPHYFLFIPFIYTIFFRNKRVLSPIRNKNSLFIEIIVFTIILLLLFFVSFILEQKPIEFPYFIPTFITFLLASCLNQKDIKIIIICFIVESFIAFGEFSLGVPTILPNVSTQEEFTSDLLYYRKVSGLCVGPSTFAVHQLMGILLIYLNRKHIKHYLLYIFILNIAIVLSFTRTIIVVSIPLSIFFVLQHYKDTLKNSKFFKGLAITTIIFTIFLVFFKFGEIIMFELTRGGSSGDLLTGRPEIWAKFFDFIKDNFLLGNFGFRTRVPYNNGLAHAHNSFIQLFANCGVIMFLYYITMIIRRINKNNILLIAPIFIASLAQYEIFWGISFSDIMFFYFLSINTNIDKFNSNNTYLQTHINLNQAN